MYKYILYMHFPKEIYVEISQHLSDKDKMSFVNCSTDLNTIKYLLAYDTLVDNDKISHLPFYDNFTNVSIISFEPKMIDSGSMIIQTVNGIQKFNGVLYGVKFPRYICKLTINCEYNKGVVIPKTVKEISFGDNYRGDVDELLIPDGVKVTKPDGYWFHKFMQRFS